MAAYPDTLIPTPAAADALDGTTHEETGVPYLAQGTDENSSPTHNQQYNRQVWRILELLGEASQGKVDAETTALKIGARPMYYRLGSTDYYFPGATGQAVTDDDVNYVYLDSAQTLKIVTDGTGWPADPSTYIRLAKVTAASGAITEVVDLRWHNLTLVTDLGAVSSTTSATIQLLSGSSGPKTKAESASKFGLRNEADDAYVSLQILDLTVAALTASGALTLNGSVSVATANGINLDPGSDTDADLVTVGVTGAPTISWDESEDCFDVSHDVNLASGKTFKIDDNELVVPYTPSVFLSGTLSVKTWEIEWVAPINCTLKNVTGRAATGPVGAALICDVLVNGASMFADQSEMVNIADGAQQDTSATKDKALSAGDVLTFQIEGVGSGTAGSDLTLVLNGRAQLQE